MQKIFSKILLFLFSTFLLFSLILYSFSNFINLENLKIALVPVAKKAILTQIDEKFLIEGIKLSCSFNETFEVPIENLNITYKLECNEIMKIKDEEKLDFLVSKGIEAIHYKKYDCDFIDCIRDLKGEQKFLYLISEDSSKFLSKFFLISFIVSLIFLSLAIFYLKNLKNIFKMLGSTFLSIGSFYFILKLRIFEYFLPPLPIDFSILVSNIFGFTENIYLLLFISGIFLYFFGVFWKRS